MIRRRWSFLVVSLVGVALTGNALAVGIHDYQALRTFSLPAANDDSGGNVLFDALPDGRLLLLNGKDVSVESAAGSGTFNSLGTISGFNLSFGPSFLAVSPDGTRAAAGSNGNGTVVVFSTADPTNVTSFAIQDFYGVWVDNQNLAIANAASGTSGIQLLNISSGIATSILNKISGATAGVAFDDAGNLYVGNGFGFGIGSDTGWVKAFSQADWQTAIATASPLNFETQGTPVVDLLSAYPIGFDASGNMFVAGADFYGLPGDAGYAALVDAVAIADALANPQAAPPISAVSSSSVLRKFASPPSTINDHLAPNWTYNRGTGELYLSYFSDSLVTVFAPVPEPASTGLIALAIAAIALLRRRPLSPILALAATTVVSMTGHAVASSPYATEVISYVEAFGNSSLYNDPTAVLGEPTRRAIGNDPSVGTLPFHVKIVETTYNREYPSNKNALTTFARKSDGAGGYTYGSVTVKFDHPVVDDPANPYNIDLHVFGNAFYVGSGFVQDTVDLRTYEIPGGVFQDRLLVSVSPNNVDWYTYTSGPYADTAFPTQGHTWSSDQHDLTGNGWTTESTDFTKPVNPTLNSVLGVLGQPVPAVDAMTMYVDSGGGTGFDLAPSGFDWIQYVRVEATAAMRDGEIDAFADVRPMRVGEALSITPLNVANGTPLYFQHVTDESRTAVLAEFSAVSSLAKLSTAAVTDSEALAALPTGTLLSTYQLDVMALVGDAEVSFQTDYRLSPSESYTGDGTDIDLLAWDGEGWNSISFAYDPITKLATLADWVASAATLAFVAQSSVTPPGDFNRDGTVDAADYTVWRDGLGVDYDENDYQIWKEHFGQSLAVSGHGSLRSTAIPEPATLLIAVLATGFSCRRRSA